jgi:hypothetical protein
VELKSAKKDSRKGKRQLPKIELFGIKEVRNK